MLVCVSCCNRARRATDGFIYVQDGVNDREEGRHGGGGGGGCCSWNYKIKINITNPIKLRSSLLAGFARSVELALLESLSGFSADFSSYVLQANERKLDELRLECGSFDRRVKKKRGRTNKYDWINATLRVALRLRKSRVAVEGHSDRALHTEHERCLVHGMFERELLFLREGIRLIVLYEQHLSRSLFVLFFKN